MHEILIASNNNAYDSPPSTPHPQYGTTNGEAFHSPLPMRSAPASPQRRSILEMDRERRARREEARKEQGTVLTWGNDASSSSSEEETSIGSPEGIPSAVPDLDMEKQTEQQDEEMAVGRGPRSHKRRRLSLRTGGGGTSVASDFTFRSTAVESSHMPTTFLSLVPAPKTSYEYSSPAYAECGECHFYASSSDSSSPFGYGSSVSSKDSMRTHHSTMLMPSLTDDHSDTAAVTPALPLLASTANFAIPHHKRKFHRKGGLLNNEPTPTPKRTSPLHFYHSQQQKTGMNQPPSPPDSDQLVCHLRPRRSINLEEEFSRQLSFRNVVGGH